jgi:malonyl-CoA O-methyltransferase
VSGGGGLDRGAIRRAFGRAAPRYEATAVLQHEVELRLLERIVYQREAPKRVLDVGAGTGRASAFLRKRYPKAQVVALDLALPMLRQARRHMGWFRPFRRLAGDAAALPIADQSIDLLFSNLCLQWSTDLPAVLAEFRRVLTPGGLLLFSTFGPDTLRELRSAWSAADPAPHVSQFADLVAIGDALLAAGFRDPIVDREHFTVTYEDARTLMRELKAIGASNADPARTRGLTGKTRLARAIEAYEQFRRDGVLPASYEVVYAQAFGPDAGQPRRGTGGGEIASFPVEKLRGSRR